MTERPVEELIGWKRAAYPEWLSDWADASGTGHRRAEVDDLAAWLITHRSRGINVLHRQAPTMDGKGWAVTGIGFGNSSPRGATIREALIAAVRLVAE